MCISFLVAQMVKNLPAMWETQVWSLGWKDYLEKGMATHLSILAWRIPWTEEPGGLQSTESQRVGHNWATNTNTWENKDNFSQKANTTHLDSAAFTVLKRLWTHLSYSSRRMEMLLEWIVGSISKKSRIWCGIIAPSSISSARLKNPWKQATNQTHSFLIIKLRYTLIRI